MSLAIRPSFHLILDSEQESEHPRHLELDRNGGTFFVIAHGVDSQYEESGIHFQLTKAETEELIDCLQKLVHGEDAE